jgi:hypothetical protein
MLYKLLVPLLRCEVADMRDSVVQALSRINSVALLDLMVELVNYVREAVDRKQENMRRRRRRDAIRLQLVRLFDMMAMHGTFSRAGTAIMEQSAAVSVGATTGAALAGSGGASAGSGVLSPTFTEYIDGMRLYLESESSLSDPAGKENVTAVREIKTHFASFINNLIGSFSRKGPS